MDQRIEGPTHGNGKHEPTHAVARPKARAAAPRKAEDAGICERALQSAGQALDTAGEYVWQNKLQVLAIAVAVAGAVLGGTTIYTKGQDWFV